MDFNQTFYSTTCVIVFEASEIFMRVPEFIEFKFYVPRALYSTPGLRRRGGYLQVIAYTRTSSFKQNEYRVHETQALAASASTSSLASKTDCPTDSRTNGANDLPRHHTTNHDTYEDRCKCNRSCKYRDREGLNRGKRRRRITHGNEVVDRSKWGHATLLHFS